MISRHDARWVERDAGVCKYRQNDEAGRGRKRRKGGGRGEAGGAGASGGERDAGVFACCDVMCGAVMGCDVM